METMKRGRPKGASARETVRINIALPASVHARMRYRCALEGKTIEQAVVEALAVWSGLSATAPAKEKPRTP